MGIKRTEYAARTATEEARCALGVEHEPRALPSAGCAAIPRRRALRLSMGVEHLECASIVSRRHARGLRKAALADDTVAWRCAHPRAVVADDSKVTHRGGENSNELGTARPVLYTTWAARDDGLLPRNLGYTIEADDVGRWTLQGLVDAHAKPKAKTKRRKRR